VRKTILYILLIAVFSAAQASAGDVERGRAVYEKYCWWCHGEDGSGDGPAFEFLNPPPRDFTFGLYKWKSTPFDEYAPSGEDLRGMIIGGLTEERVPGWDGLNGTSMPGWSDVLNDREIEDVIEYIKSLAMLQAPVKEPVDLSGRVRPTEEGMERGGELFRDRCSECHGELGRGDGQKKLKDDYGDRTWPRNLTKHWTFRAGRSPEDIYTRVTAGVHFTQMPSFADPESIKKLTENERWDIANYVSTLNEPYKKPGDDAVIKARRMEGEVPSGPEDAAWEEVEYKSFYMVPQIMAGERLFKPSIDSISVKALYNDRELALLIEWDDHTGSVPGDKESEEIAGGEVFRDAVAVEFPSSPTGDGQKPYFGMGSPTRPVNIWFWQGGTAEEPQGLEIINARGIEDMEKREAEGAGFRAEGYYDRGTWRVVIKRPLLAGEEGKDIQFKEGVFIPIAFAAWDGSNGDTGSRHVMTAWQSLVLETGSSPGVYAWSAAAALVVLVLELLWLGSVRRR